jgi:xanthine dehydrogenase accessory factor
MDREVFAAVAAALERGEPAALVTIVSATGSTPQRVGAKMLVFEDGRIVGTIGGGCYENDAFWKAREAIERRKPQLVHYELSDDFAQETGLICGGQMDVYIEPIEPSPELYIVGAGHVAFHLARLADEVGFRVHVIDDREKFANRERFPGAVEVVADDIPAWLSRTSLPPHAYAVIVTRGHTNDLAALRALAPRDLRYLGLIGSRAKIARIYDALSSDELPADALKHVHAPIGLDIGAVTPQEIAVSILAELIAVKHGKIDAVKPLKWTPPERKPHVASVKSEG